MSAWYLATFVLISTYVANLVAALTVTIIPVPFSTLGEMAEQTIYKYGILGNTAFEMRFRVSILNLKGVGEIDLEIYSLVLIYM